MDIMGRPARVENNENTHAKKKLIVDQEVEHPLRVSGSSHPIDVV